MKKEGYFGEYGGCFVPETLVRPLHELKEAYLHHSQQPSFQQELSNLLHHFVGRPTALTKLRHQGQQAQIYLKREDLAHTGAHKINNVLGQALLAKAMGKKRIIAETGAGQHGVATATVCALLKLDCVIYMGAVDAKRQAHNLKRMRYLGAECRLVEQGSATLKDAVNEALRDWVASVDSYYLLGSALGPHPYPTMVRDFQKIIGQEAREQILKVTGRLPDELVACVGGGSNALGLFYPFLGDQQVKMTGVEAGGKGIASQQHAARFAGGRVGVFQGMKSFLLQDQDGQVLETHSISAGLDYSAVGPEHAHLHDQGRVHYTYAEDKAALSAAKRLAEQEGIIPALESAHALAYAFKLAEEKNQDYLILVNLSGRGDKDLDTLYGGSHENC